MSVVVPILAQYCFPVWTRPPKWNRVFPGKCSQFLDFFSDTFGICPFGGDGGSFGDGWDGGAFASNCVESILVVLDAASMTGCSGRIGSFVTTGLGNNGSVDGLPCTEETSLLAGRDLIGLVLSRFASG